MLHIVQSTTRYILFYDRSAYKREDTIHITLNAALYSIVAWQLIAFKYYIQESYLYNDVSEKSFDAEIYAHR